MNLVVHQQKITLYLKCDNTDHLWVLFWKLPLSCIIWSPLIKPPFLAQGDSCLWPEEITTIKTTAL